MSQQPESSGNGTVTGKIVHGLESLAGAAAERAMSMLKAKVGDLTNQLTEYAAGQGGPGQVAVAKGMEKLTAGDSPVKAAASAVGAGGKEQVKKAMGRGGDGGGGDGGKNVFKDTHIVESIDVGVPVWLAYNQWTQFKDFPSFMKKVEDVEQEEAEKIGWKAQVLWSHRHWESTIIEQVPDERIVWQSKGDKGSVDGAVSFHELTPDLTRILVVLQYHPQGFVEKTGNIWRAPGRRVRLELKHFVRHVMTDTVLHPDDVPGWRGEIRDGQLVEEPDSSADEEQEPEEQEQERDEQKPEEPPAASKRGRSANTARDDHDAPNVDGRASKSSKPAPSGRSTRS
jgi:uncharacterized membrane protein